MVRLKSTKKQQSYVIYEEQKPCLTTLPVSADTQRPLHGTLPFQAIRAWGFRMEKKPCGLKNEYAYFAYQLYQKADDDICQFCFDPTAMLGVKRMIHPMSWRWIWPLENLLIVKWQRSSDLVVVWVLFEIIWNWINVK